MPFKVISYQISPIISRCGSQRLVTVTILRKRTCILHLDFDSRPRPTALATSGLTASACRSATLGELLFPTNDK